jgi:hypothetical protein
MAVEGGRKVKIAVDTDGTGGSGATWVVIGMQRGGGSGRTSETADATNKDNEPWSEFIVTRIGWTVSADGVLDDADTALGYLRTQWKAGDPAWIQIQKGALTGGQDEEGQVVITDLSEDYPDGDVVSFTFEGQGTNLLADSPL